jgi:hypothetical protein
MEMEKRHFFFQDLEGFALTLKVVKIKKIKRVKRLDSQIKSSFVLYFLTRLVPELFYASSPLLDYFLASKIARKNLNSIHNLLSSFSCHHTKKLG